MDVACRVLDRLGIVYSKKLAERRSRVSCKDNERTREVMKVAVAATKSLLSVASDDEETFHQLITGASLLLRPPVESENGGYAVADVFMRAAANNDIYRGSSPTYLFAFRTENDCYPKPLYARDMTCHFSLRSKNNFGSTWKLNQNADHVRNQTSRNANLVRAVKH
jgi:hypothetical protein